MSLTLHPPDKLIQRLRGGGRPIVFLVGSALTAPIGSGPGVPSVAAMLDLIRARVAAPKGISAADRQAARRAAEGFERALDAASDGGARYQVAFEQLKALVDGAASANAVIRDAVLRARTAVTTVDTADVHALARLERSPDGWHLGPAVKALGLLAARDRDRFGRLVLTTNFDPLVELAIRAAGGQAHAVEHLGDGSLAAPDPTSTAVVHLHGLWRADTLHTPGTLTVERGALRSSLARVYQEVTLVVVGYGGWDDVLTATLAELARDAGTRPDVVWCFFQSDPRALERSNPRLVDLLTRLRERVVCYGGVDCNKVLPQLRAAVDGEGELLGRETACNDLLDAVEREHAVEILGEASMKRSALLAWVAREAGDLRDVALLSARELASATPEAFVRRVGGAVGRLARVEAELHRRHAVPTVDDAVRALQHLVDVWILLDDAEALARPDHGFTEDFFNALRARVQARQIRWVSVAGAAIGPLFQRVGLTSQFLNDTTKIYAGGLDRAIVERALHARLGPHAPAALTLAGTLPRLVYRLCEAEWDDPEATMRDLPAWAEGICDAWWQRSPAEQALLKRVAAGATDLTSRERSDAADLCRRGLLVDTPAGYTLNGKVWEDYVRSRP